MSVEMPKITPGKITPDRARVYEMADEAVVLALAVEAEPWRKLAMRAALAVARCKTTKTAVRHYASLLNIIEKNKKFGKIKIKLDFQQQK
jgi:hypothetical protein